MIRLTATDSDSSLSPSRVKRIGLFKFRNIGDVLMITPALRALRETFPQAEITVAVNSVTDAMLRGNPHVNRVLVFDRAARNSNLANRLMHETRFFQEVRRSRFDLTIDFTSGDRPARYSWFSGARVRIAFRDWRSRWTWRNLAYTHTMANPSPPVHEVERHLQLLHPFGIKTANRALCFVVDPADPDWAIDLLRPLRPQRIVHLHPVARWLFKCWDDAKMAAIIDWLELERNVRAVITSSDQEAELAKTRTILRHCRSKPLAVMGKTTLGQLAAISEQADCFFGVDSAPMHIAAAVGIPVVSLFGPTHVAVWHPWCEKRVTLVRPCRCNQLGQTACDWNAVRACLQEITVEEVKTALIEMLK